MHQFRWFCAPGECNGFGAVQNGARRMVKIITRIPHSVHMAPALVPEPFHRDGWVYEEKVEG